MTNTYKVKPTPLISLESDAEKIYNGIMELNPKKNEVTVDMRGVVAMTMQSINIVFGNICREIGIEAFQKNVTIKCHDMLGSLITLVVSNV